VASSFLIGIARQQRRVEQTTASSPRTQSGGRVVALFVYSWIRLINRVHG
jgi:hypothetical protein